VKKLSVCIIPEKSLFFFKSELVSAFFGAMLYLKRYSFKYKKFKKG